MHSFKQFPGHEAYEQNELAKSLIPSMASQFCLCFTGRLCKTCLIERKFKTLVAHLLYVQKISSERVKKLLEFVQFGKVSFNFYLFFLLIKF
jgi:hypothetical protein